MSDGDGITFVVVMILVISLVYTACDANSCYQKNGKYLWREWVCVKKDAVIP